MSIMTAHDEQILHINQHDELGPAVAILHPKENCSISIVSCFLGPTCSWCSLGVLLGVAFWKTIMGSVYIDDCPYEPKIPIYLIVTGVALISTIVFSLLCRHVGGGEKDHLRKMRRDATTVVFVFLGSFIPAQTYWVFKKVPPRFCQGSLYWFAFGIGILEIIGLAVSLVVLCYVCLYGWKMALKESDEEDPFGP